MAPDLFSPTYGPSMPALRSCRLGPVLCGLVLIGGLLGAGLSAHESRAEQSATEVRQQAPPSQDSATTVSGEGSTPSVPETDSAGESVIEFLLEIFILGPIITILLGLLLAFPTVLLSVSLVMDGGCLRFILFGIGWLSAIIYGAFTGMIVGEAILGLEFLVKPIFHLFMWGYPVAAVWGHRKLEAMPEEQYRAWDQTLTGGALLGFGAGSIAGLARSVASGRERERTPAVASARRRAELRARASGTRTCACETQAATCAHAPGSEQAGATNHPWRTERANRCRAGGESLWWLYSRERSEREYPPERPRQQ